MEKLNGDLENLVLAAIEMLRSHGGKIKEDASDIGNRNLRLEHHDGLREGVRTNKIYHSADDDGIWWFGIVE